MNKVLLTLCAICSFGILITNAQSTISIQPSPKQRADMTLNQLQQRLQLSDIQKNKLYEILYERYVKLDSLLSIKAPSPIVSSYINTYRKKISETLTSEQLIKYDQWNRDLRVRKHTSQTY